MAVSGVVLAVLGVMAVVVLRMVFPPYVPTDRAVDLILNEDGYSVRRQPYGLVFFPEGEREDPGLIFYPGGNVDYRAYSYWGARLAQAGHVTVIVRMPFHLAVLAPNRADRVIDDLDMVERWYLAGHSLGGAMAGRYVAGEQQKVSGLVLLGAYVDQDLRPADLAVASLMGSRDGVISQDNLDRGRALLPTNTIWAVLEGGNHAYFGDYGLQRGDGATSISFEVQRDWAVDEVLQFLRDSGVQ